MTNAVNVATTALKTIASAPEAAQSSPHIAQSVEATSDWLASFTALVDKADGYVWGVPLIAAILVTGLILTCVLRLSHIFNLREAFRIMFSGEDAKGADGEVSQFGALCTALSERMGLPVACVTVPDFAEVPQEIPAELVMRVPVVVRLPWMPKSEAVQ